MVDCRLDLRESHACCCVVYIVIVGLEAEGFDGCRTQVGILRRRDLTGSPSFKKLVWIEGCRADGGRLWDHWEICAFRQCILTAMTLADHDWKRGLKGGLVRVQFSLYNRL